jgi:hypothetical protein
VLDATGSNYTIVFFVCASVYVIATVVIHFILPRSRASMVTAEAGLVSASYGSISGVLDRSRYEVICRRANHLRSVEIICPASR